ncbi:MAG: protein TolR [Pseudomonadota bacterium]|nr:protein TolR [Pseudomonadota bacterium]
MRKRKLVSDINVVPYIDVMLVLLVVFMVSAPLMVQGILLNLPEASNEPLPREQQDPLIISVDSKGQFYLEIQSSQNEPLALIQLSEKISSILKINPSLQVVVRGDGQVEYQRIISLMSELQNTGVDNVGLITSPSRKSNE